MYFLTKYTRKMVPAIIQSFCSNSGLQIGFKDQGIVLCFRKQFCTWLPVVSHGALVYPLSTIQLHSYQQYSLEENKAND